jgi:hypothetical protein
MKKVFVMKNYNLCNDAEKFFVSILRERTYIHAQYNSLPTCTCFSFCLNELIRNCKIYLDSEKKINHLSMTKDFYDFMLNDTILKRIDESQYYNLLICLKDINTNSANITECYPVLIGIRNIFINKYFNELYDYLVKLLKSNCTDYDMLEMITNIFINELLSLKLSYLYFNKIFVEFFSDEKFNDIYIFLDYITCDNENIEMYLPLKKCTTREIQFISEKQEIIEEISEGQSSYSCKIYDSTVDYYELCDINKRRIESLLNFFKFYRDSEIDFDYDKKVKIKRKVLPYIVSISLALLLALFTGHIFTAPSVSIYISLIIAYVLTLKPIKKDYGMISE